MPMFEYWRSEYSQERTLCLSVCKDLTHAVGHRSICQNHSYVKSTREAGLAQITG